MLVLPLLCSLISFIFLLSLHVETARLAQNRIIISHALSPLNMNTQAFGALFTVEGSTSNPTHKFPEAPERALPHTYHSVPHTPDIELDSIQWGARLNGPPTPANATPSGTGAQTPRVPNDLEMSRPATPVEREEDGVHAMQSFSSPPMNRPRMATVCLLNFTGGLSDSAPGALIPYMQK